MKTTVQVRLYPTPEQSWLLMAHCQEYISTVNVLVAAFDSDVLRGKVSTKDFIAFLPSAVKNQALRDAQSVFQRSFEQAVFLFSKSRSVSGIIKTGASSKGC